MSNKKIIFVCFEETYVGTIEYKLAEILKGKAELEFITNESYLLEFLHSTRTADVLLISKKYENLIDERFGATKVIWLTEDKEFEQKQGQYGDEYMYLYTSVRSMIDRMDSSILLDAQMATKNGTQLISVFSVTGGCGKTMAALGMAYALTKEGNKVLYVSTESMQDYQYYIPDVKSISSNFGYQCAVDMKAAKRCVLNEIEHGDIDYLRPFPALPMSYQVNNEKYYELVDGIVESNIYDYIVVELSKEIEAKKIAFMQKSQRTVFITTQQKTEIVRLYDFINSITRFATSPLLVCNRFDNKAKDYFTNSELAKRCEIAEYIMEAERDLTWDDIKRNGLFEKVATLI